ncbi:type II toxin-antitoxin system RelE/ParE family toxin [Brevifollis gellanilyticus]|uniref:Plasmid stabilization protein n=1 Tax=Brevifollis gellanilyticus TaxID=748831 RepID=A0A512MFY8_9BACT|nr:type II toxin-antitoxin system RelE/ParE family toxin [Brevifollis gellanilyticus]GEP45261.1 hypothetical protein BGE01nite_45520 [Brevifollis gellanilyticus]
MKVHDVVWTLAVEADVQAIYEDYEQREEGAGDVFYADLLNCVQLLARHPLLGSSLKNRRLRRVLVYNRHFGLFYVPESRGVVLHALIDLRRDPEMLARRLRDL